MTGLTQPWHIVLILMIGLLLFGGKRLPEIGRSLGSGMREFKDSLTGQSAPEAPELTSPEASATSSEATVTEPTEGEPLYKSESL